MGNKSSLMLQDEEIKQISEETGFSAQQIEKLYTRFTHLDRSSCGSLSANDLLSIPELAINPLCERLIEIFFADCPARRQLEARNRNTRKRDRDRDRHHHQQEPEERINFKQFMRVLAAFRSHNSNSSSSPASNNSVSARQSNSKRPSEPAPGLVEGGAHERLVSDSLRDKLRFVFKIYDADADGRISFGDLRTILKLMVGNYVDDVQLDRIATRAIVEVDRDRDGFIEFHEFCKVFAGKDLDLFRLSI